MSDTTPEAIAQWMLSRLGESGHLYQIDAVEEIARKFGPQYTYTNDNGSPAINRHVLEAFKKITAGTVVWDRRLIGWRTREPHDEPGRRQP
jgi:hypothetical protein